MNHERKLFVNEDGQCNSFRSPHWYSHAFEFSLGIPRSRSGNFHPALLGLIRSESEDRAKGIQSTLYQRSYHLSVSSLYKKKRV